MTYKVWVIVDIDTRLPLGSLSDDVWCYETEKAAESRRNSMASAARRDGSEVVAATLTIDDEPKGDA